MKTSRLLKNASLVVAVLGLLAADALAQYPNRPIRIVHPFPSGGVVDAGTRVVAQSLSHSFGQPAIVEAKPGADGQIASLEVRKAVPDGYTLLVGVATSMSMVPAIRKEPPYDPVNDFTPLSHLGSAAFFVTVHSSVPARSLSQLVAHARANPDMLSYASGSGFAIAATAHFMHQAGIRMVHVPYKGEGPVLPDLLTGRVQVTFATPNTTASHIIDGKLRALATLLPERSGTFPEVPTMRELGYPEVPVTSWAGIFGPANMPRDIVERLSKEINIALARPEPRQELDKRGFMLQGSTPDELTQVVRTQLTAWQRAVKEGWIRQD